MERLTELFRVYCLRCADGKVDTGDFDWIPGKILRCLYDKDFRWDICLKHFEPCLAGSFSYIFVVYLILVEYYRTFGKDVLNILCVAGQIQLSIFYAVHCFLVISL